MARPALPPRKTGNVFSGIRGVNAEPGHELYGETIGIAETAFARDFLNVVLCLFQQGHRMFHPAALNDKL